MLHQFKRTQSNSDKVNLLIGKLLKERNELLGLFLENVSAMPFARDSDTRETWEEFGERLMSYPTRLHFQTCPELEQIGTSQSIDRATLHKLKQTTNTFVDFHDRYFDIESGEEDPELHNHRFAEQLTKLFEGGTLTPEERAELFDNLKNDLSVLGETLGDHVVLEDKLLDLFTQYLKRTRQISTSMALSKHAQTMPEAQSWKTDLQNFGPTNDSKSPNKRKN